MNTEELLKPRYKVIADYLFSPYKIGEIISTNDTHRQVHLATIPFHEMGERRNQECFYDINDCSIYPALYKKLEWWEEREEKDLPKYIRLNESWIVKVAKHHCMRFDEFQAHDTKYNYSYAICTPATEEEYNQFLKGNNTQ